jgi:hypothetical protein
MKTVYNIGSAQFKDSATGELSYMVVRAFDDYIGIGMAQESSGEAEIFMDIDKCELLIGWISEAIAKVKNKKAGENPN